MKSLGCANERVICYPDLKPEGSHDYGNIRSQTNANNKPENIGNQHT